MTGLLENDKDAVSDADFVDIPGSAEDISEAEKTIDDELNSIFSEFGGDDRDVIFKIRVSRIIKNQGQSEICFYCIPQELPIFDRIKNEYGPGMYVITVFKNNLKFRNRNLNIAAQIKAVPVPGNNTGQDLSVVLGAMAEMQQKNFEQMQTLLLNQPTASPATPPINPMQMLIDMAPALTALKSLFPSQNNSSGTDMLLKGMELMKDVNSDSGGEKGIYDMLMTAAKEFGGPLIEMAKVSAANPLPVPAVTPGAEAPPHDPRLQAPEPSESEKMGIMLNMQINGLVQKAAAGADPALYADLIIDSMTPEQIHEFIGRSDLKEFLISVNPQVETLWPWFESLQREVTAGLTPQTATGDTPDIESPEIADNATPTTPTGNTTADT